MDKLGKQEESIKSYRSVLNDVLSSTGPSPGRESLVRRDVERLPDSLYTQIIRVSLFGPDSINGPAPLETMGHSKAGSGNLSGGGNVRKSCENSTAKSSIGTKYICIKAISSTANLASGLFHTLPFRKVATTCCVVLMRLYGESIIAAAVTLVCSCIPVPWLTPASQACW